MTVENVEAAVEGAKRVRLELEVTGVNELASGIRAYEFGSADRGEDLPPFEAGAHLTFLLPSGLERQYSLCNDPADRGRYVVAVKREDGGRGGSREVHEILTVGTRITARPPVNLFPLAPSPSPVLLIAGGIGATPLVAMAHQLRREARPFRFLYLVRSRAEAAFLDQLSSSEFRDNFTLHVDEESGGPHDISAVIAAAAQDVHIQCCGPTPLMKAVETAAQAAGWAPERAHFEYFSAPPADPKADNHAFVVHLARQNRDVDVAADQTILDALLSLGLDIDYSCSEGTCGTCITRLMAGDPDHRDAVLMPHEKADHIMICCSRAKGDRLVLDL